MRTMVVRPGPRFSVSDVSRGWVNGLRDAGCEVVDLNFDDRLTFYEKVAPVAFPNWDDLTPEEQAVRIVRLATHNIRADVYDVWPELIVVISGFFMPPDWYAIVRNRGHKIVLVCTESPYEDDRQLQRAPHADLVILNDPTNIDRFRAVNPNTHYFPHAYDPTIHYPTTAEKTADFAFVGTGYKSRVEFFEKVDWSGLDVRLGGYWEKIDDDSPLVPFVVHDREHCYENTDAANLYRSTRVAANLYRKEATAPDNGDGWAMGPREVELAACGAFFLREPRGEGDGLFPFLPTFTEPAEFEDLLRYYLAHPEQRSSLATLARNAVADRTFKENARRLLALVT